MKNLFILTLITIQFTPSLTLAQEPNKQELARIKNIQTTDGIIAASLVFKIKCLLSGEMGFLTVNEKDPLNAMTMAFKSYAKNLDNLSSTERGKRLKKEGLQLIDFLTEVIAKTASPVANAQETKEFETYLRKHGLKIFDGVDPIDLANLVSKKINDYNKLAGGPDWTFNSALKSQK